MFAVAVAAIALDTALLGVVAPLLPEIERRTGATELGLGFALGAYSLPLVLLSIPIGRLTDRIGRRPLLLAGLLLTAVGSLLRPGRQQRRRDRSPRPAGSAPSGGSPSRRA